MLICFTRRLSNFTDLSLVAPVLHVELLKRLISCSLLRPVLHCKEHLRNASCTRLLSLRPTPPSPVSSTRHKTLACAAIYVCLL